MGRLHFAMGALACIAAGCSSGASPGSASSSGGGGSPSSSTAALFPVGVGANGGGGIAGGGGTGAGELPSGTCFNDEACNGGLCRHGKCVPPSAGDGKKNGSETDVDCGGQEAPKCASGKKCASDTDCVSDVCKDTCQEPSPTDGKKNGIETDVDCGGSTQNPACPPGKTCNVGTDCLEKICEAGLCSPPGKDGVQNGTETDVDCGGDAANDRCDIGKLCAVGPDCIEKSCAAGQCVAPTAEDGVTNGTESDIDCGGGPENPRCQPGQICYDHSHCDSQVCQNQLCQAPTPFDGTQNGGESDVDCGGPNAPACGYGRKCVAHTDCASLGCHHNTKTCAEARSCVYTHGGQTCGVGETGLPGAQHESCCIELDLPTHNTLNPAPFPERPNRKMDKYIITAGRFRAFFDATGGNMRGYIQANRPSWWPAKWDAYLPASEAEAYWQLGPFHDNPFSCYHAASGARTFWQPPNQSYPEESNYYVLTKEQLDEKPMNCVNAFMLNAFCWWDRGGRLPFAYELGYAWMGTENRKYPWGSQEWKNNPERARGHLNADRVAGKIGPAPIREPSFPPFADQAAFYGSSMPLIHPPGRSPQGVGPFGHHDLAGDMLLRAVDQFLIWGGSWEVHAIRDSTNGPQGYPKFYILMEELPFEPPAGKKTTEGQMQMRYWAIGGRCIRDY